MDANRVKGTEDCGSGYRSAAGLAGRRMPERADEGPGGRRAARRSAGGLSQAVVRGAAPRARQLATSRGRGTGGGTMPAAPSHGERRRATGRIRRRTPAGTGPSGLAAAALRLLALSEFSSRATMRMEEVRYGTQAAFRRLRRKKTQFVITSAPDGVERAWEHVLVSACEDPSGPPVDTAREGRQRLPRVQEKKTRR